jgi:hypothetical protein
MGLFMQRPEEPSEWAGLPGEPVRPRSPAEVLPDDGSADAVTTGILGVGEVPLSSIVIPLTPAGDEPEEG